MWKNCFICEQLKNRIENSQCINGYRTPILLYYWVKFLEFQPEFCRNDCRHSAGILLELLPACRWYSEQLQLEFLARIPLEWLLSAFRWNSWLLHPALIQNSYIETYVLISFIYTRYQVIQINYYAVFHRTSSYACVSKISTDQTV